MFNKAEPNSSSMREELGITASDLPRRRFSSRLLIIFGLFFLLSFASFINMENARAEGSRDLYPNPPADPSARRAHLEWRTSKYGPSIPADTAIFRRTLLRVYAKAGENILMGSSAMGVGAGDIILYAPGQFSGRIGDEVLSPTPVFKCSTQRTGPADPRGTITTRTQELGGAQAITGGGNPTGYTPCYYTVPANGAGIYAVAMYGRSGDVEAQASGPTLPAAYDLSSVGNQLPVDTSIAAWDVTVRSSNTADVTDIRGRVFAYYFALFTGDNTRPTFFALFATTTDGYRYRIDMNSLDPNGFIIYSNRDGYLDYFNPAKPTPLYHNVIGQDTANQQFLNTLAGGGPGGLGFSLPQNPLFFTNTGTDPNGVNGVLGALNPPLPTSPTIPVISNLSFSGTITQNISLFNTGGTIRFISNVTGRYQLVISRDGVNFDPRNSQNRYLTDEVTVVGPQQISVTWDGKDNAGNPFPVNSPSQPYLIRLRVYNGELHFPLLDAENSVKGGPFFTLLNATNPLGNQVGFYDDRGYVTKAGVQVGIAATQGTNGSILCPGNIGANPSIPASDFYTGFNTSSTQRAYGATTPPGNPVTLGNENLRCDLTTNAYSTPPVPSGRFSGFGDVKGLDIWTFFPSNELRAPILIVNNSPRMTVSKNDGKTVVTPQERLDYIIGFANVSNTPPPTPPAPGAATSVVLTDNLPPNTNFLRCIINAPYSGNCSLNGRILTIQLNGRVDAGQSGSVLVSVEVDRNAPTGNITNTVQLDYKDEVGNPLPPVNAQDIDTVVPAPPTATPNPTATIPPTPTAIVSPTPATPTVTVTPSTPVSPRLTIGKTDGKTVVTQNERLDYTVSFVNVSNSPPPTPPTPGAATNIVIADNIPPNTTYISCSVNAPLTGSCDFANGTITFKIAGKLDAGQGGSVTVSVQVNADAPSGNLTNTVSLNYTDENGKSLPPISTSDTDIIPPLVTPRLTIGKTDGKSVVTQSEQLDYTVSFANVSNNPPPTPPIPAAAANIVIADSIPPNTTYISCSVNAPLTGSCDFVNGTITFKIDGKLDAGQSGSVAVSVQVNADAPSGDLTNNATLNYTDENGKSLPPISTSDTDTVPAPPGGGGTPTPDPAIPTPTPPAPPVAPTLPPGGSGGIVPDPFLKKVSDSAIAVPGQTVKFTITFNNSGAIPVDNLVITDPVPRPFIVQGATSTQGTVTVSGQTVSVNVGTVPPGSTVTIVITTVVANDPKGEFVNPANATGTIEGKPYNGTSTAEVSVPGLPNTGVGATNHSTWFAWLVLLILTMLGVGTLTYHHTTKPRG